MKKHLEVAAAILVRGGKILCAKRGAYKYNYVANKFEFPGGKLEAGETKTAALERELREEMGIETQIGPPLVVVRPGLGQVGLGDQPVDELAARRLVHAEPSRQFGDADVRCLLHLLEQPHL